GAVHQHAAAADQVAAFAAAARTAQAGAGQPVATDCAPASWASRDPAAGGIGGGVRQLGGVWEVARRPSEPCGFLWWSAAGERERARCDALSSEPDGGAERAAAAAARLSRRPVRAEKRRGAGGSAGAAAGSCGGGARGFDWAAGYSVGG